MSRPKSANIWDDARKIKLFRTNPYSGNSDLLEPGVNFFILALEFLGATTRYSCEGHPNGFLIRFAADHEIARKVAESGYFRVIIDKSNENGWDLRLSKQKSERDKRQTLRWAADAWLKELFDDQTRAVLTFTVGYDIAKGEAVNELGRVHPSPSVTSILLKNRLPDMLPWKIWSDLCP